MGVLSLRQTAPQTSFPLMRISFFALLFLLISFTSASAQPGNPAQASDSTSLSVQFEDMLEASSRYQQFKVVRQDFLRSFLANVNDSIRRHTEAVAGLRQTISTQSDKISNLTQEVKSQNENIATLQQKRDSINLLGITLSKSVYALLMWALVFGLLLLAAFAFLRMRVAITTAAEARENGDKLAEELEKAKKRRLEVEQSLRRQLQDEINKRNGQ